jgi:hypothetical protein
MAPKATTRPICGLTCKLVVCVAVPEGTAVLLASLTVKLKGYVAAAAVTGLAEHV